MSRLSQLSVLVLKGLQFKLYSQNFDLIKISAQKYINFQKFDKTEKSFNLCRNGKGSTVIKLAITYPHVESLRRDSGQEKGKVHNTQYPRDFGHKESRATIYWNV